jgi:hypothetical protein
MIQIKFINFWPGFDNSENYITYLLKINNIPYKIIHDNLDELNFIFIGSFIYNNDDILKIMSIPIHVKKIFYLSEPIEFFYPFAYKLFNDNIFDYVFGSIDNKFDENNKQIYFKFPLYTMYFEYNNKDFYTEVNNINKLLISDTDYCEYLLKKNKICLINSHDKYNLRTLIYNKFIDNKIEITCPGKLFNNASNEELNKIGKKDYLKNFIFNICPENVITKLNGYITEKLLEACISGCIPIYCGWFDEFDTKIFNKNRILFYDNSEESINNCVNKVKKLLNNNKKLVKFYKQPIFNETAFETLKELETNFFNILK